MQQDSEHQSSRPRVRAFILGLIHALFFVIAFPPIGQWWGVFIAPIPLFLVARDPRLRPTRAALWCALGTIPGWLWLHWWIKDVSTLGLLPLVMLLSAFTMLYIWLAARIVNRYGREDILLPLIFVGVEFFRASVFATGYPWYMISHPLIDSPMSVLAMPAAIAGVPFVSFLLLTYSMLLYKALRAPNPKARKKSGFIAAGLFACWVLMGLLLIPPKDLGTPFFRFAVVQPDVPQDNRIDWTVRQRYRDWLTLRDITVATHQDRTNPAQLDVVIWPEGFVPGWTFDPVALEIEREANLAWRMTTDDPDDVPGLIVPDRIRATDVVDNLLALQRGIDTPMLVGAVAFDNLRIEDQGEGIEYLRDAMYNSAFIVRDGLVDPVWYDKLHLTPFGEVMPYISTSETLEKLLLSFGAQGMEFALDPGKSPRNLSIPLNDAQGQDVSLATPICFEATVSSVCRKLVARQRERQAQVMVNINNDGWFGSSQGGREAHLQLARWRCIELATPMIRSANTGISAVIDHRGQVIQDEITPLGENPKEGHLIGQVHVAQGLTPFALMGDAFGWLAMLLSIAWGGSAIFASRRDVEPIEESDS